MQSNFYIQFKKDKILIFLLNKLFLCQVLIKYLPLLNMSKKVYTFFYISKVLTNFGLIAPINRKFGY